MSTNLPSIGVILTVYKRSHYQNQLYSILSQTISPKVIYIWRNESHVDVQIDRRILEIAERNGTEIHHIHSKTKNFKFHGRFTIPLLIDTEYSVIFDDDTIPAPRWFENCLRALHKHNAIVGANGRIMVPAGTVEGDELGVGDGAQVNEDTIVDFVGHCWFFKREWIHHMWSFYPNTFENGEDIHFAASCSIRAGIRCVVPRQLPSELYAWGDTQNHLGIDEHATWRKPNHTPIRKGVKDHWINLGWKPINLKRAI